MKASTLLLAVSVLFGSSVLADHWEAVDATPYVCMRGVQIMGAKSCSDLSNGIHRQDLDCPDASGSKKSGGGGFKPKPKIKPPKAKKPKKPKKCKKKDEEKGKCKGGDIIIVPDPDEDPKDDCPVVCCLANAGGQTYADTPYGIQEAYCIAAGGVLTPYRHEEVNADYQCAQIQTCIRGQGEAPSDCGPKPPSQ